MFEIFKHNIRQVYYEYFKLPKCHYFYIFKKVYELVPEFWNNIIYDRDNQGFIITDFVDPSLSDYSGREIAFFNASQVHVFWLPGATHSGQGHVENGQYEVIINCGAMKKPFLLNIMKDHNEVKIESAGPYGSADKQSLPGGYVIYSAIKREMKFRILDGLTRGDQKTQRAIHSLLLEL